MKKIFETMRLYARCWQSADFKAAKKLWADPQVIKYIETKSVMSDDDILQKLQIQMSLQVEYAVQYWPLVLKSSDEVIGCCGLRPYDLDRGIYELGFHIMSDYWGQGFATEAAKACIDFAFNDMNVSQLFAGHNPGNKASRALLIKLGFVYSHDAFYEPTGLNHPSYFLSFLR